MDKTAPGRVYLCQVNENIFCGVWCGLYNVPDLSRFRDFCSCFKSEEEVRKAGVIIESLWEKLQKGEDNYDYC